jgi:hypothetical protein
VVQVQAAAALRDQPLVAGCLDVPVVDHQVRSVQDDPHPLADQTGRDRVAVSPHGDLAIAVDPWREQPARFERLLGQWQQQRLFVRCLGGSRSSAERVHTPFEEGSWPQEAKTRWTALPEAARISGFRSET